MADREMETVDDPIEARLQVPSLEWLKVIEIIDYAY